jgi:hypothetical protein
MRILSLLIICSSILFIAYRRGDNPHGKDFKISCDKCHSSKGWFLDKEIYSFNHNTTRLPLKGSHADVTCRKCHQSLVFSEAKTQCSDCHNDVHQATVGLDCERCHTPVSWLVNNITEIHQMSRFPLVGAHRMADCIDCHKSENFVRFDVIGVNCVDCHRQDYQATTNPDHVTAGFSEDCSGCHPVNAMQWAGAGFNHSFFPLAQGHSNLKCTECHKTGNYADANPDCISCHQQDYNSAANPNHTTSGFPTNCTVCHTLSPGWQPASFTQHDSQYFPIYSGKHKGTWNSCTECHPVASNFASFTCISCHEHNKSEMDNKHSGETGYSYNSAACYQCHPTGVAEDK